MTVVRLALLPTLICTALLTACGGGGSSSTPNNSKTVAGVILVPEGVTASSQRILAGNKLRTAAAACADVPAGYQPLAQLTLSFVDANGKEVSTATTDACGHFNATVGTDVTQITANPSGMKPIQADVSRFTANSGSPALISTVPSSAHYVLSVLQYLGQNQIAFSVTDDQTGKAVLGLDPALVKVSLNDAATSLSSMQYGASAAQNATVSLVMDVSGSMSGSVYDANNQPVGSRRYLAARAAHALLDGLTEQQDEAGLVYFDDGVYTLDDATIASYYSFIDKAAYVANGSMTPVAFTFSSNGLTQSFGALHTLVDASEGYGSALLYSNLNQTSGVSPLHAKSRQDLLTTNIPFGGSTAFYDATRAGLDLVDNGKNARQIIVALTDGMDNSSSETLATLTARAQSQGVPVYTVAFGEANAVDEAAMQSLATDTGAEYKRVNSADITGLFQSIQTGIRFQYTGNLGTTPTAGQSLKLSLTYQGETIERSLTIQ